MDLYTSAMGMISNMVKLETISNNIANSQTAGYKYDEATFRVFEENFIRIKYQKEHSRIGSYNDKVYVDNVQTNFKMGDAKYTERTLDMMLDDSRTTGTSFFVVERENGEVEQGNGTYLTRNGHFLLDADRRLATISGGLLLNEQGEQIRIPEEIEFSVNEKGQIYNTENGEIIDTIQIRTIQEDDLGLLEKVYGGFYQIMDLDYIESNFGNINDLIERFDSNITIQKIFRSVENLEMIRDIGYANILMPFTGELRTGFIESSNVDMGKQMTQLIQTQKGVEMNQRTSKVMNEILQKDANEIGK